MRIINFQAKNFDQSLKKIIINNRANNSKLSTQVAKIIAQVKKQGDQALIEICNRFDNSQFKKPSDLLVGSKEINQAWKNLDRSTILALELALKRISDYHQKQLPQNFSYQDQIGVTLGNKWQAIENVAIYVPGGSAPYPSSVLMGAIPAMVAGVKNIVMTTPSTAGKINDIVLGAASLCGIKTIYKVGGAASIAALAFGTNTITKVDKIVGPGNSFVALAKKHLFGEVGIDMIAGPTDILIIADNQAKPDWVAADLLSQLEHGKDSRALLITDDLKFAKLVKNSLAKLSKKLSRQNIISESLKNSALIVVADLENHGIKIANQIAPEHLEIITRNPNRIAEGIKNAGAIFLGEYSPEAIGDYIAGPSHTLPTMGTARFSSGLSVFDFLKRISIISCSKDGFEKLGSAAETLAASEGFDAHKLSITIRRQKL